MVVHKERVDVCNKTLICWGQVAATFQKVGLSVRGLLLWMQVVTLGKVTLGQVVVKGWGGMENGCRHGSSATMHSHVLVFPSCSYSIAK